MIPEEKLPTEYLTLQGKSTGYLVFKDANGCHYYNGDHVSLDADHPSMYSVGPYGGFWIPYHADIVKPCEEEVTELALDWGVYGCSCTDLSCSVCQRSLEREMEYPGAY